MLGQNEAETEPANEVEDGPLVQQADADHDAEEQPPALVLGLDDPDGEVGEHDPHQGVERRRG